MRIKFNKAQMDILSQYEDILIGMAKGTYRGAVLSRKQRVLGDIYDQVATNRCSSCNNNWIKRLGIWYIENKKRIEQLELKKLNSSKKKQNKKKD